MYKSVVLILITPDGKLLLERKPDNHKNEPSQILLPGGHIEEGETPEETAHRELMEEFKISNVRLELVKNLKSHVTKTGKEFEVFFFLIKEWDGKYEIDDYEELVIVDFNEKGIGAIDIESNKTVLSFLSESWDPKKSG